jgi:hypothetical protein
VRSGDEAQRALRIRVALGAGGTAGAVDRRRRRLRAAEARRWNVPPVPPDVARIERNHLLIKAVAVAGGWSDIGTMLRCYDHPDDADVLAVTSETRRRRERPAM